MSFNFGPSVAFRDLGPYSLVLPNPPSGDSEMLFFASGTPAPSMVGTVSVAPHIVGHIVARLQYEVEIVGPDGLVPVLTDVSAAVFSHTGLFDSTPVFILKAAWGIDGVIGEGFDVGPLSEDFSDSFSHFVGFNLTANQPYLVTLSAEAFAAGGDLGAAATVLVDPVFHFAPGVDPAYSFQFSDGIGNSSIPGSVPEPGSVVLLSIGAIGIGFLHRRSRLWSGATPGVTVLRGVR